MSMRKIVMAIGWMLLVGVGETMAGRQLELAEVTNEGRFNAEPLAAVVPLPADGESYAYIAANGQQVVNAAFKTGKQTGVLFDAKTARGATINRVEGYLMSPDGKYMLIQTQTTPIYRRSFTAVYYIYDRTNNKLAPLSNGGPQQTPVWSPDGTQVAFVRDNNIHLVKLLYNNAESQVTTDGRKDEVINGLPDWVNEEEFSHNTAMVFTADSKQLVWVRYDERQVRQYRLPRFGDDGPYDYVYKYPLPGEANASVALMSYDIKSHQTRTLQLPIEPDGYIPRIRATNDPTKVAVVTLNRHQDNMRVYMANPLSTICQLVINDNVEKYINEDVFGNLHITDHHIVMTSERNGYSHIYVYALNGQLQASVGHLSAAAPTVVTQVYGYDEATGDLYFAALADGPLDQRVYVRHRNGKVDCLTPRKGWSTAIFSSNYKYFIHTWSDIDTPPVITTCSNTGKVMTTLIDNKMLAARYEAYGLGSKELFTLTTTEGVTLNGWMVKPADFDPQRQYPVVMYQYGGPGSQQVRNTWDIGMYGRGAILEQYLAQQGYIVVCVDNRGTGGRGADFEKCTYLRLGELEATDQVEAALWLGRQSYVDKDRIGIWGWSYGGWNTLMAMSEGRPVFCCGVAIAPPTTWRLYDTIYTERFMRTPQENAAGYDEVCPLAWVKKLHGALLLCHGLADDNVHYEHTAKYVDALIAADKDFTQLVYTNRNHSIYGKNTRNHLFRQCFNFFNSHLKK